MRLIDDIQENIISCKIIPNSQKNEYVGRMGNGVYKIRITAIPEKGKANIELIKFLAKELEIPQKSITILAGENSQNKRIKIDV